ncbi:hypothetical protein DV735_g71, partial [Chaetothyriales sp. CBS 134920]
MASSLSANEAIAAHDAALQRQSAQTLANKVAIISGSSSGIGKAIAIELAHRGASVVINYPTPSLEAEAATVLASLPTPSRSVCADIGSADGPAQLVKAAVDAFGTVDIVVNNAAIAVNKPFAEQTLDDWDRLVNINGRGTFLLTQAALPFLPSSGGGRIVNVCSASSRGPPPGQTIYAGTKGMVDSFTRCWAKELPRQYGVTVNAVSPGPTRTEGFAAVGEQAMKLLQPTIDGIPVAPRMAEASEIAYAVAFLCEERSRWINGVHLHANGGLLID